MPKPRVTERRARVAELNRAGASLRDIARQCDTSYETVRRDLAALGINRRTIEAARQEAAALDVGADVWAAVRADAIAALRVASQAGNVQASKALINVASEHDDSCKGHVPLADVETMMLGQFEVWRKNLNGPFTTAAGMAFGISEGRVRDMLIETCENVKHELNVIYTETQPA